MRIVDELEKNITQKRGEYDQLRQLFDSFLIEHSLTVDDGVEFTEITPPLTYSRIHFTVNPVGYKR